MDSIQIGLIGLGTVGTGVYKLLQQNTSLLKEKVGIPLKLKRIAVLNLNKTRTIKINKTLLTNRADLLTKDKEINIIIELIGGEKPARELILSALANRKHVITANKALLAKHGQEIFFAAQKNKREIGFEASVGGGIPIIRAIRDGFTANRIESIYGIVNGTANYILSKMSDEEDDFEIVLKEAQEKGYAEADPGFDLKGLDSAHKIAILAGLAFGQRIPLKDIYVEGISRITAADILYAREFGYRIKLLSIAKNDKTGIEIRVHPTMIPASNPIANINGVLNAIKLKGDFAGENLLIGQGAGSLPTASAVVSDLVDISRRIATRNSKESFSSTYLSPKIRNFKIKKIGEISSPYYLRFSVFDKPGVLSKLSGILGKCSISISAVIQKGRKEGKTVPLVIMTHRAREKDLRFALAKIEKLKVVQEKPMLIRVEDE